MVTCPLGFKIVSGGQTGADQAALDWAIHNGIAHGGWCPKGRRSEAGEIPTCYSLTETPDSDYLQRTEWNVRDSDATLVFTLSEQSTGGSKKTVQFAQRLGSPCLHVARSTDLQTVSDFLSTHRIHVLNVAGSRESKEPSIRARVFEVLDVVLKPRSA
ncbi:MAG TPA: putative molybdenum carrier protein [Usitatibacter sp.]|nr:putative molybdenum carrier protein [Usitatibacter sp.]